VLEKEIYRTPDHIINGPDRTMSRISQLQHHSELFQTLNVVVAGTVFMNGILLGSWCAGEGWRIFFYPCILKTVFAPASWLCGIFTACVGVSAQSTSSSWARSRLIVAWRVCMVVFSIWTICSSIHLVTILNPHGHLGRKLRALAEDAIKDSGSAYTRSYEGLNFPLSAILFFCDNGYTTYMTFFVSPVCGLLYIWWHAESVSRYFMRQANRAERREWGVGVHDIADSDGESREIKQEFVLKMSSIPIGYSVISDGSS
jgi:hypothetical protein